MKSLGQTRRLPHLFLAPNPRLMTSLAQHVLALLGPTLPAEISIPTTADTTVASAAASVADANSADEITLINEASTTKDNDDAIDDINECGRRLEPAIDADPDRAVTHLCTRIMADLDGWNGEWAALDEQICAALQHQPRSSSSGSSGSGGGGGSSDTAASFKSSVRDSDNKLWDARSMLCDMNAAQAHVSRARYYHALALKQLAAWVALRAQQADVLELPQKKDRLTRVLNVLEALDQERNRRAWWRCLTAGQRWTALAMEFGIGVAVIQVS